MLEEVDLDWNSRPELIGTPEEAWGFWETPTGVKGGEEIASGTWCRISID